MDTEARHTERDRSSGRSEAQASDSAGQEGRSRFALVPRLADWLPVAGSPLALVVCLAFCCAQHFRGATIPDPQRIMEQALAVGDRVLVNKLAYRFGAHPRRGDIVVFDGNGSFGGSPAPDYVKRVVGVGGDRRWRAATTRGGSK